MNAKLFLDDGTVGDIRPSDGKHFTFAELYPKLECTTIQVVYLQDGRIALMDEEGKFNESKKVNVKATEIAHHFQAIFPSDKIVGHAVICDSNLLK